MKFLDKVGLVLFSNLILIICVILCLIVFGWLDIESIYFFLKTALADPTINNIVLGVSIALILLALKCIFFTTEDKKVNGIKNGILLKNDDGQLVISKTTLEELVTHVVSGFDSAQNVSSKIVLDQEKRIVVYVTLDVKENAVIKELSNNMTNKIKTAIKNTSDLEVKEVNVSIRNLETEDLQTIE